MNTKKKILNAFAGVGGNRKRWQNVEVTAVELNEDIANVYKELYPDDEVIVGDAHEFIRQNYDKYDLIWSSVPCQSHSQIRYNIGFRANRKYAKVEAIYPDMMLYQEIIFLKHFATGLWVVENVRPYYEPLIPATLSGGHLWRSNFKITDIEHGNRNHGGTVETLQQRKEIDLSRFNIANKRQILRNAVEPEVGAHILSCAFSTEPTPAYNFGLFDNVSKNTA
jgi:DNA (cytosine-5)-methyltransferase 1